MAVLPDGVRPASFRGVAFDAREVGFTSGRRLVTHEYHNQDEPYNEDQGRATRRWRLQCFLCRVGDEGWSDFQRRRAQLREAFEAAGPATLVHPTDGDLRVRVETIDETISGLWLAEYQVSFVESGAVFAASTLAGPQTVTLAARLKSIAATAYSIRRSARRLDRMTRKVLSGTIYDRAAGVLGIVGTFTGTDVSTYIRLVSAIRDANTTLVDDAEGYATAWQDVCDSLTTERDGRALVGYLLGTAQDPGPFLVSQAALIAGGALTASAEASLADVADTDMMLVTTGLAAVAALAVSEDFASYDDAIAARDAIAEQFSTVVGYTTDADSLAALQDTLAAVTDRLTREALDLPRLRVLTLSVPRTAVQLSYALYGTPERAQEIVDRNNIADPNLLIGEIQVLTE